MVGAGSKTTQTPIDSGKGLLTVVVWDFFLAQRSFWLTAFFNFQQIVSAVVSSERLQQQCSDSGRWSFGWVLLSPLPSCLMSYPGFLWLHNPAGTGDQDWELEETKSAPEGQEVGRRAISWPKESGWEVTTLYDNWPPTILFFLLSFSKCKVTRDSTARYWSMLTWEAGVRRSPGSPRKSESC